MAVVLTEDVGAELHEGDLDLLDAGIQHFSHYLQFHRSLPEQDELYRGSNVALSTARALLLSILSQDRRLTTMQTHVVLVQISHLSISQDKCVMCRHLRIAMMLCRMWKSVLQLQHGITQLQGKRIFWNFIKACGLETNFQTH